MVTTITNTQSEILERIELFQEQEEPAIPCFFCGICCTKHRVKLSVAEAQHICEGLGLNWYVFLSNYVDPSSAGADSFYLRQQEGVCIFLKKRGGEHHQYMCLVHIWRPTACREWNASLYRKECQDGLQKYWGLGVTADGQLRGYEKRIQDFQLFLKSLEPNTIPTHSRCENTPKGNFYRGKVIVGGERSDRKDSGQSKAY